MGKFLGAVLALLPALLLLCGLASLAQAEIQVAPSVSQKGIWIPNPVQQMKKEIHHKLHRFTAEGMRQQMQQREQRFKQHLYHNIPGLERVHHLENKLRNIKNALQS